MFSSKQYVVTEPNGYPGTSSEIVDSTPKLFPRSSSRAARTLSMVLLILRSVSQRGVGVAINPLIPTPLAQSCRPPVSVKEAKHRVMLSGIGTHEVAHFALACLSG